MSRIQLSSENGADIALCSAIIDGSGVLHDPNGIDRSELTRLAKARQMIVSFDKSKLSKGGFVILVEDKDVTLPSECSAESGVGVADSVIYLGGEYVADGMNFR